MRVRRLEDCERCSFSEEGNLMTKEGCTDKDDQDTSLLTFLSFGLLGRGVLLHR